MSEPKILELEKKINNIIEESIKGIILYENANGTTRNVTLSESAKNFRAIEIYYRWNAYRAGCVKVQNPYNGMIIQLDRVGSETWYYKRYTINEENLTLSSAENLEFFVDKVIGYR